MKIVVIDGHGGKMGRALIEKLRAALPQADILAVGTNSTATAAMLRAGANDGATGENPVVVACRNADCILGPLGILSADALHGEVTPAMALAIGQSPAQKVLLPVNRCNLHVVGCTDAPLATLVQQAADKLLQLATSPPAAGG